MPKPLHRLRFGRFFGFVLRLGLVEGWRRPATLGNLGAFFALG